MSIEHPKSWSTDEVGMWLVAIGLGSKVQTFRDAGVDGSMLMILGNEDFSELGLSGLQGKKLLTSRQFVQGLAEGSEGVGGGGGADSKRLQELENENFALRQQLAAYQQPVQSQPPAPAPAPTPPPPPAQAPAHAPPKQKAVT
jgi:SAM domain (Sterile alpha motif)